MRSSFADLFPRRVRPVLPLIVVAALTGLMPAAPVAAADPVNPLFFGCSRLITFDDGAESWRAVTTNREALVTDFGVAGWSPSEGNPGGSVKSPDLDGYWSELWTPPLRENGYDTDYRFAIGGDLQFDYRNNTGIGVDVYVVLQGASGERLYYVFRSQIADSTTWNRIRVPMDPAQWKTGFDNNTGPNGAAPGADEFAAALSDVDYFGFSIEGQTGPDTTLFDNFGAPCEDYGDAPASYGTALTENGPSHRITGLDDAANTAPLMLGGQIDADGDGESGARADGDDARDVADEDGLPTPPVVVAGEPSTVDVSVTNSTGHPATLAGWLDLNGDGTFEENERAVAPVQPGSRAAAHSLEFPAASTTEDTYARFRLFPGEVADPAPTGSASGGEVEDHLVPAGSRSLAITKTSTAGETSRVGDVVEYTVTVTNTGQAAYTENTPATWTDDLTGVLDDARYNDDATTPVGYAPPKLTWSGPLPVDESVSVTYSVTVTGGGDGQLRNTACLPDGRCEDTATRIVEDQTGPTNRPPTEPLAVTGASAVLPLTLTGLATLAAGACVIVHTVRRRRRVRR